MCYNISKCSFFSVLFQDVDQNTGEDLNPSLKNLESRKSSQDIIRNPDRPSSLPLVSKIDDGNIDTRRHVQRISSPERWEIKQVIIVFLVIIATSIPFFLTLLFSIFSF